jgi:hypothetical protein
LIFSITLKPERIQKRRRPAFYDNASDIRPMTASFHNLIGIGTSLFGR